MKAVLKSVLKLDATQANRSPALLKGSILHKAMEYYFLKLKSRDFSTSSLDLLSTCFDEAFAYYEKKRKYYDDQVMDAAFKYFRGNTALYQALAKFLDMKYYQYMTKNDATIEVEMAFEKTPVCGYNFNGRIDLIFDKEVVDFKTVGQGHNKKDLAKYQRKMLKLKSEFSLQLLTYKDALEHKLKKSEIEIPWPEKYTIIEVVLTKSPVVNEYTFTKEEIQEATHELTARVSLAKKMLKEKLISRNYRDTMCPCSHSAYCMNTDLLKQTLSKLDTPTDFF